MGPKREPSELSLPSAFSRTVGNDRKRRVCPVGAVSKTMTEYSIDFTCLLRDKRSSWEKDEEQD